MGYKFNPLPKEFDRVEEASSGGGAIYVTRTLPSTVQNIPNSTLTDLIWGASNTTNVIGREAGDIAQDGPTGTFTIGTSGLYTVCCVIRTAFNGTWTPNSSMSQTWWIYRASGGTELIRSAITREPTDNLGNEQLSCQGSLSIYLEAGDTIQFKVYHNFGLDLNFVQDGTYMSMVKVG